MCKRCLDPNSLEGSAVRSYWVGIEPGISDENIVLKVRGLWALDDERVSTSELFSPETDTMPDGIHAKPSPSWQKNKHKLYKPPKKLTTFTVGGQVAALNEEYDALPDPKPDYLQWASLKSMKTLFEELYRQSLMAERESDRNKAISTLLEFSKSKPKQTVEVVESGEVQFPDLFRRVAKLGNVPPEVVESLIGTYFGSPTVTH